jgi:uncharacterized protein (TIGR03000 family)
MYGMVLLAALTPAADPAPATEAAPVVVSGCAGCAGCTGVVLYGCAGCTGCYGCTGCHGGLLGWLHAKKAWKYAHRAYAIVDGGWGCSCLGACYGSAACYGCYGAWLSTPWVCHGGCYGGYYGIGSAFGPSVIMVPTVWGHRTSGGWGYAPPGIYGAPYAIYGQPTVPQAPPPGTPDQPKPIEPKPGDKEKKEGSKEDGKKTGAHLKFVLPAEAKLYVDGRLTTQEGTERAFTTPPLQPGQLYYYDVAAELTVAGQTLRETKRVIVQAGADITETFGKLFAAVEGRTVPVAGK